MALHDFTCPACRIVVRDCNIPIAVGAAAADLACPLCERRLEWIPQIGRMDAKEPFHKTTVEVNGVQRSVESLNDIRRLEKETEQRYRNGEGQPLVWRDYSQNRSNSDQHTLAKDVTRSMSTQDGFAGGLAGIDRAKVGVARGDVVRQRHGDAY